MRKITEIRKNTQAAIIAFRRFLVASLISTPGTYGDVGADVSSELFSASLTPCSFSACFLAASDLNVGRAIGRGGVGDKARCRNEKGC
jgi:hypothetical protein